MSCPAGGACATRCGCPSSPAPWIRSRPSAETYRNLSDEEKEELSRQGEEGLEQLREDAAASSSDDDDDPDDEDFSDRSWLQ
ncbi:hypothetical protein [Saccharomonospora sp. CUA-673]|uniref:hypothetical protein n=1 Tax=Saccharomonospora sp. CUA-673 TaxID=1904969 RepID=UPI002100A5C1|nr:hypothetical protein [Saccharomonospora sp. CUA-673]